MECPSCIGFLEERVIDDRKLYVCPICGHQISTILERDAQRWWGSVHLPLIDVFTHPSDAFRQLRDHPVVAANLALSLSIWIFQWHFMGQQEIVAMQKLSAFYPWLLKHHSITMGFWPLSVLFMTFQATAIHLAAQAVSPPNSQADRARFEEIWSVIMFLSSISGLFSPIVLHYRYLKWGLIGWHWVWTVWAIQIIYGFEEIGSVGVWALSCVFDAVGAFAIGLVSLLVVLAHPGFYQKLASKTALQPVHQAAEYNWQVKTLDGRTLSISDLKGKVIFLNFWATWCGPCRMEMGSIQRLYDHFKANSQIVFLCVSEESGDIVRKFLKKNSYTFPIYVTEGAVPPTTFVSEAIPVTYIISPQGEVVAEQTGAGRWDTDATFRLLEGLTHSPATALPELQNVPSIPAAAPGDLDIPVHPMMNLNFKRRQDILAVRRKEVLKQPKLAPAHYRPDPDVFQMVDGKPWWGTVGLFFYSQGARSIEGLSEQSRFLMNPYLLTGLREAFVVRTNLTPPTKDDYVVQVQALRWRPSDKMATAFYDLSNYFAFAERVRPGRLARTFFMESYNARDLGFHFMAIDRTATHGVEIPAAPQPLIPLVAYIHLGNSCHYPGGCNNSSPDQNELHVEVKDLPALVTLKFWRAQPTSPDAMPDMTFELLMQ